MLLLLALACDTSGSPSDGADTGNPSDTATNGTAETGDTADTDTADPSDTDTASGEDADADGYVAPEDCDDTNDAIHPGATETCDGVDENCDGSIDEGNASLALLVEGPGDGSINNGTWYGFDADDNAVLLAADLNADGVFNSTTRWEWANGFMVAEDRSNDGALLASRTEYDREADGRITEVRFDNNGDGVWEYSYGYIYTDDVFTGFWFDEGNDGDYDQEYGYVFNSYGMQTYYWTDNNGDGDLDGESIFVYDADHMISGSMDSDGDGVFETTLVYTWEGNRLVEELITGGSYPYRRTYGFTDADDYWDTAILDYADDGVVDYYSTQTVAADGTITGQTSDQYGDGVDVYSRTYEVDAEGNIRNTSYMDGVVTSVNEYTYDDSGMLATMRGDTNGDGYWEWAQVYDPFGHLISQVSDSPSDGIIEYIQTWSYDERGRRLGATTDALGDGTFEFEQWPQDGYACGAM